MDYSNEKNTGTIPCVKLKENIKNYNFQVNICLRNWDV